MTDWPSTASALAATVGLVFAGRQSLLANRQAREDRELGLRGVAVHWEPRVSPVPAEVDNDGNAIWVYDVVITNPGRFPIDHVQICWHFPIPVHRKHFDGTLDAPTQMIPISAPVLPGGAQYSRERSLQMDFKQASEKISEVYAILYFNDINGKRRENRWPRVPKLGIKP